MDNRGGTVFQPPYAKPILIISIPQLWISHWNCFGMEKLKIVSLRAFCYAPSILRGISRHLLLFTERAFDFTWLKDNLTDQELTIILGSRETSTFCRENQYCSLSKSICVWICTCDVFIYVNHLNLFSPSSIIQHLSVDMKCILLFPVYNT